MAEKFDLIIRGGRIVDGSGGEPFSGDVAVKNGLIAAVGQVDGVAAEEIDAGGKIVTPGFVDIHTHYDGQITWENTLNPSSEHGVTTVVMGNCGVGFAPCRPEDREALLQVMEGVEDIPEVVMSAGLPWNWETFPDYLDAIEERVADIDFATLVPHAAVRVYVMGQRGVDRELATEQDMAQMRQIVREGLEAGALGVSTSQSHSHRRPDGELAPSVEADYEELVEIAKGLADVGTGVFQLIPNGHYGGDSDAEMALFRRLATVSGRPLMFSLVDKSLSKGTSQEILEKVAAAQADGLPIRAQIFPRPIGVMFGLELAYNPFIFHPSYSKIEHLPIEEKVAALRDPEFRAQLLSETPTITNPMFQMLIGDPGELYPLGDPPNYEPDASTRLGVRAERENTTAHALALDTMLENDGRGILLMPSSNYVQGNLDPVRNMMVDPNTLIALGDGGAHYGLICDSSFTTFTLTHWVRDRSHGRVALEWAVQQLTSAPAEAMGLTDRGRIAPGYKADLNVIDLDKLRLYPPTVTFDLPAGGRRLRQRADGYECSIVSGTVTYRNGQHTGELPGRLIRKGAHKAAQQKEPALSQA